MMLFSSNSRIYFRLDMGQNILKVTAPARTVDMATAQQFLEAPDENQVFVDDLDARMTGTHFKIIKSDGVVLEEVVVVFVENEISIRRNKQNCKTIIWFIILGEDWIHDEYDHHLAKSRINEAHRREVCRFVEHFTKCTVNFEVKNIYTKTHS